LMSQDNSVWQKTYYTISIADKDGNVREKRSKKAIQQSMTSHWGLIDHDAFSSLARQIKSTDNLVKIRWFWGNTIIGSTGWFPVNYDPEVVRPLEEKAKIAHEKVIARRKAERGET
jgi:hypothetical protein